jgi:hypothetical protein
MNAPFAISPGEAIERELDPIAIDPRPCGWCGLTIDRHRNSDSGEGPEFFCAGVDDAPADIVRQWEMADPRDRWRHTGEAPPPEHVRNSDISARPADKPQSYRTAQSTIDAFGHVVRTKDADGIAEWLASHPMDEKYLQKIWERKCSTAAAK